MSSGSLDEAATGSMRLTIDCSLFNPADEV